MNSTSPSVSVLHDTLITNKIFMVRGTRVMLDRDLAELYGVSTKVLNQAVKRNRGRFPPDFMFVLTAEEKSELVAFLRCL